MTKKGCSIFSGIQIFGSWHEKISHFQPSYTAKERRNSEDTTLIDVRQDASHTGPFLTVGRT